MNKIHITNLDKLKITRVKDWCIYFTYDGVHYFLHGESKYGELDRNVLYIRNFDNNSNRGNSSRPIGFRPIGFCYGNQYLLYDYISKQKGKTIVYSQIDKDFFAYKLTSHGFATGIFETKVAENKIKVEKYSKEIAVYRNKIHELQTKLKQIE